MIDFIEGIVADKQPNCLVMNAGGVGFLLSCSGATVGEAPAVGERWRCYSVMNVREDAIELFGFASKQEREMFRRLCQVTGVGAKTALSILSAMPLRNLSVAIATGDVNSLSRAPGVGKKTAQRIILELKDKIEQSDLEGTDVTKTAAAAPVNSAEREAQAALMSLGYSSAEAARAVNLVRDQAESVDKLVMLALRQIGSL